MYCDAHLHIVQSQKNGASTCNGPYRACTCAHTIEEFAVQQQLIGSADKTGYGLFYEAFGIHPQMPVIRNAEFLESLLERGEIDAIGEAGFDFFTHEFAETAVQQESAWAIQIDLALQYRVPIVVHCRKALDHMFRDSKKLKMLKAVVFHSFSGGPVEARSLLKRGINAWFSFGKPLLNGNKRSIACVRELPTECLLLETDAPFQTLKGETYTRPEEIAKVYRAAFLLRYPDGRESSYFYRQLETNFTNVYGKKPVRQSGEPAPSTERFDHTYQ